MSKGLKDQQNGGASNVTKDETTQEEWYIYTAHYPKSKVRFPMLRMIICNCNGWILAEEEEK